MNNNLKNKIISCSKKIRKQYNEIANNTFASILFILNSETYKIKDQKNVINGILYKDQLYVKYKEKGKNLEKYKKKTIIYNERGEYEIEDVDYNYDYLISFKNKYYNINCLKIKLIKRR